MALATKQSLKPAFAVSIISSSGLTKPAPVALMTSSFGLAKPASAASTMSDSGLVSRFITCQNRVPVNTINAGKHIDFANDNNDKTH